MLLRRAPPLLVSLALHALALGVLVIAPLLVAQRPPDPLATGWRVFFYDPPPAAAPPLARGPGLRSGAAPARPVEPPPDEEPAFVAPQAQAVDAPVVEEAGGDPEGSAGGDPEGMPGGVLGGIVGGIPGGVVGGVIGGTGTGPALPVPVLRPDTPPRVLRTCKPVYPQDAFVKKIEGTVLLEILIDARGLVARATVLQSIPALDQAALDTVRTWLFVPATHAGIPVASLAQAPITFRIY